MAQIRLPVSAFLLLAVVEAAAATCSPSAYVQNAIYSNHIAIFPKTYCPGFKLKVYWMNKMRKPVVRHPASTQKLRNLKLYYTTKKIRYSFTEQALHKSQPLVISNITHEKAELLTAGDLKGRAKLEQLCLQLLSVRICPGGAVIDVPLTVHLQVLEKLISRMAKVLLPLHRLYQTRI